MAWVRLDDAFPEHAKVERAGETAAWMFVCGLCYCSRALTDGFIVTARMHRLCTGRYPERTAEALVREGLWDRVEGGFQIHDYLDYQPPSNDIKARRRANAERQERYRERQRNADSNASPEASVTQVVTAPHTRDTRVGTGREEGTTKQREEQIDARKTRSVDQSKPPVSLPDDLLPITTQALVVIQRVQVERGGVEPTMRGVGLAVAAFQDRDHLAVAGELEHWATAGRGQRQTVKDWARTYRTFLERSPVGSPSHPGQPHGPKVDYSLYDSKVEVMRA